MLKQGLLSSRNRRGVTCYACGERHTVAECRREMPEDAPRLPAQEGGQAPRPLLLPPGVDGELLLMIRSGRKPTRPRDVERVAQVLTMNPGFATQASPRARLWHYGSGRHW